MTSRLILSFAIFLLAALPSMGLRYNYIRPEDNEYAVQSEQVKKDNRSLKDLQSRERALRRKKNKSHKEKSELKEVRSSINELMKK